MGPEGFELTNKLGFKMNRKHGLVQVANSHVEFVCQEVFAPMRLESKTKEMSIRILHSLPVSFFIGLDFLKVFRMDIDFENRNWIFEEDPSTIYNFDLEDWKFDFCCGLHELTDNESLILQEFLNKNLPINLGKPGLTPY